jgi:hypothetical protein
VVKNAATRRWASEISLSLSLSLGPYAAPGRLTRRFLELTPTTPTPLRPPYLILSRPSRRNRFAPFKAKSPRALQGEIASRPSRRNRLASFKAKSPRALQGEIASRPSRRNRLAPSQQVGWTDRSQTAKLRKEYTRTCTVCAILRCLPCRIPPSRRVTLTNQVTDAGCAALASCCARQWRAACARGSRSGSHPCLPACQRRGEIRRACGKGWPPVVIHIRECMRLNLDWRRVVQALRPFNNTPLPHISPRVSLSIYLSIYPSKARSPRWRSRR